MLLLLGGFLVQFSSKVSRDHLCGLSQERKNICVTFKRTWNVIILIKNADNDLCWSKIHLLAYNWDMLLSSQMVARGSMKFLVCAKSISLNTLMLAKLNTKFVYIKENQFHSIHDFWHDYSIWFDFLRSRYPGKKERFLLKIVS